MQTHALWTPTIKKQQKRNILTDQDKMEKQLNYYRIKVYEPYEGHKELILSHKDYFDEFEFNSIIQDIIDETILDHIKRNTKERYCDCLYWNLWGRFSKYRFGKFLRQKGFNIIHPISSANIQDKPILSNERYKNIKIPPCKGKCHRETDESCPIVCKKWSNTGDAE